MDFLEKSACLDFLSDLALLPFQKQNARMSAYDMSRQCPELSADMGMAFVMDRSAAIFRKINKRFIFVTFSFMQSNKIIPLLMLAS